MKTYVLLGLVIACCRTNISCMDIQLRRSPASELSHRRSATRWAHSYCLPGILVGSGIAFSAITYIHSESASLDQTIWEGAIGAATFSAGLIWYGINKCIHNLAQDIRDLTAYNV